MRFMTTRTPLLTALGQRIRDARLARGWSQKDLCARAEVSPRFLVMLERGEGNPSLLRLVDIARALEIALAELVRDLEPRVLDKVALVGLRGAGKSTIGAEVARELAWSFVELGREIESQAGMSTGEVFEYHGAARYREWALEALERLLRRPEPAVIEVGGSLVVDPAVLQLLRERTVLVWLRATPEQHLARVRAQGDLRPMAGRADALGELRQILAAREPLYAQAAVQVDTVEQGRLGTVRAVVEAVRKGGGSS